MMKCCFVALLAILGTAGAAAAQWTEYRPPGAGFRIEFPGKPAVFLHDVPSAPPGTVATRAYMGTDRHGYFVIHAEFPTPIENPDAELDEFEVMDLGIEKRLSETPLNLEGAVGRRYVVEMLMGAPEKNSVVSAVVVIRGSKVYVARASSPAGAENSPEVQRFLDSFALVP